MFAFNALCARGAPIQTLPTCFLKRFPHLRFCIHADICVTGCPNLKRVAYSNLPAFNEQIVPTTKVGITGLSRVICADGVWTAHHSAAMEYVT